MKSYFLLYLFLSTSAFAENYSPFDFLEASRKLMILNQKSILPDQIKECTEITSNNNESILSCSIKDSDCNTPIVKVDYDSGKIPPKIKSALPDQFIQDIKNKAVSCVYRFKLMNDNVSMSNKRQGDDYGRTHAFDVSVSCSSKDSVSTAFTYSSELFTQPVLDSEKKSASGLYSMKQNFNAESIFQILQDNKNGTIIF